MSATRSCRSGSAERGFGRLKQRRGIATCYDKHAIIYLGGVTLAAIVLNHRSRIWQTRPRLAYAAQGAEVARAFSLDTLRRSR